ncbi:MAG: hypothetical protein RL441_610 [Actinomycetota bacterium]|jgi:3-dehydroquinate synthase
MTQRITVAVEKPYEVTVGRNLLPNVIAAVPASAQRVCIIHAGAVSDFASSISAELNRSVIAIELPDGEQAKTYEVLTGCWDRLGREGFTRSDVIISVGGGATTDLAGFVAASWLRGIGVIHVPTTLLAMVDAAVGGKTGINSPAGKNLIGAFHHPLAVFCDLQLLESLPVADLRAGFGEIIKCGFIADATILTDISEAGPAVVEPRHELLASLVFRSVAVKAEVVADDFTESKPGGLGREILNYGHTLGHAIELTHDYSWRHGEAISVGMVFVAELARLNGLMNAEFVEEHRRLLSTVGLPVTYSEENWDALLSGMAIDKKSRGNTLRFVALAAQGTPTILSAPPLDTLEQAFRALAVTK